MKKFETQLSQIEELIKSQNQTYTEFLDITEASVFLKLKKSTIYQLVYRRKIPFYKRTKKLLFKKSELIEWVEKERVHTINEFEATIIPKPIHYGGNNAK